MKLEQIRPNLWRVRKQVDGKRYEVTFSHKPSQKEVLSAISEKIDDVSHLEYGLKDSIEDIAKETLRSQRKSLSPTTLESYESIVRNTPRWFLMLNGYKATLKNIQKVIDEYASTHSPKSTKNFYAFYSSVFARIRPEFKISVNLPHIDKELIYEPTTDDIRRILEHEDTTDNYGLAFRLLALGLRRGEVCALTSADITDDDILTINKTMIYTGGKHTIKDSPKTDASNRRILIPHDIAERLREQGKAYSGAMSNLNKELHRTQKKLNIPSFRLHIIRHFAAAYMLQQGFSTVEIEDYMGWEHGSTTMQRVYAYVLDRHESQKDIASAFGKL